MHAEEPPLNATIFCKVWTIIWLEETWLVSTGISCSIDACVIRYWRLGTGYLKWRSLPCERYGKRSLPNHVLEKKWSSFGLTNWTDSDGLEHAIISPLRKKKNLLLIPGNVGAKWGPHAPKAPQAWCYILCICITFWDLWETPVR